MNNILSYIKIIIPFLPFIAPLTYWIYIKIRYTPIERKLIDFKTIVSSNLIMFIIIWLLLSIYYCGILIAPLIGYKFQLHLAIENGVFYSFLIFLIMCITCYAYFSFIKEYFILLPRDKNINGKTLKLFIRREDNLFVIKEINRETRYSSTYAITADEFSKYKILYNKRKKKGRKILKCGISILIFFLMAILLMGAFYFIDEQNKALSPNDSITITKNIKAMKNNEPYVLHKGSKIKVGKNKVSDRKSFMDSSNNYWILNPKYVKK